MGMLQTVTSGAYIPPSTITQSILRESLLDMVYILDPYDTPVMSMLEKVTVESPVVQWIVDRLPTLILNNTAGSVDVAGINVQGILEGFEPAYSSYPYDNNNPQRDINFVQIFAGLVRQSDMLKRGRPVGIRDPYNHDVLKVTKVIGMANERRWFDNPSANASYVAGSAADPRRMHPLYEFTSLGAAGAAQNINQVTAGTTINVTVVDSGMEACVTAGGLPEYLLVGVGGKVDFSISARSQGTAAGSTIPVQSYVSTNERKILRQVDIYHGEYGPLAVVMCRQIPESSATTGGGKSWLIQRDMLAWGEYLPLEHVPLAKTGHNTKGMLVGATTIIIKNGAAHCMINNVTT